MAGLFAIGLVVNNDEWLYSYQISTGVSKDLQQLSSQTVATSGQKRRVFILSWPSRTFNVNSEEMTSIYGRNLEVGTACIEFGTLPGDTVVVKSVGNDRYSIDLPYGKNVNSRPRPISRMLRPANSHRASWFKVDHGGDNPSAKISILGRKPGDVVAIVEGNHLRLLN